MKMIEFAKKSIVVILYLNLLNCFKEYSKMPARILKDF